MVTPYWKIVWTDNMSVGIPEIDDDHKRFAGLVNTLNQSIVDRMDMSVIRTCMTDIIADAQLHFAHEENLFKEWHYPDAAEHIASHSRIAHALKEIESRFKASQLDPEIIADGLKIKEVLIEHILVDDMKYINAYRNSTKSARAEPT